MTELELRKRNQEWNHLAPSPPRPFSPLNVRLTNEVVAVVLFKLVVRTSQQFQVADLHKAHHIVAEAEPETNGPLRNVPSHQYIQSVYLISVSNE